MPDPAAPEYERNSQDLPPGENPPDGLSSSEPEVKPALDDAWVLSKTRSIYTTSTDYRDTNIARQWERSLAHFRGDHAPGSRYKVADFKRSKVFRPKTRANVKQQESAFANAAFSTVSVVEVQPQNPADQKQTIGAAVTKALMEYRLEFTVPWTLTAIGAYQNTKVYGICISEQYWDYRTAEAPTSKMTPAMNEDGTPVTQLDEESGEEVPMGYEEEVAEGDVLADKPAVDLVEPENFRFDPMSDWRDPASTSPYLIRLKPYYAGDVVDMGKMTNRDGKKPYRPYELNEVLGTRKQSVDRTRQAREGNNRTDPAELQAGDEFTTVWVHANIVRVKGIDYHWLTVGTELILSEPTPLRELQPWLKPGERNFRVGFSSLEAHRNYPAGDVEQSAPLQEEINDIANQRMDNVKLVLNKRYFVRRGSQTDLEALMRNVPGGGVMVNDPEKDIKTVDTNDVTGSSYQEQDRLNLEFDELVGGFSQGSVMSNRKMNETVGGMDRIASSAGAVQDYGVNVFIWTWYEPVLRQIQRLLSYYESDQIVVSLAAQKAKAFPHFSQDQVMNDLLEQEVVVRVNVGLGNTDPVKRVERLTYAIGNVMSLPGMAERIKSVNIANDVFGALGFKDASRHFMSDEEYAAAKQNAPPPQLPPEIQLKAQELQIRQQDNQARDQREKQKLQLTAAIEGAKLDAKSDTNQDQNAVKVATASMQNKTSRDIAALQEANKITEANLKVTNEPPAADGPPT